MFIKSKQLYILIGDDRTGKTTLQKLLIKKLCGHAYDRLPTNLIFPITHADIKRKYQTASFGNRSYQEKIGEYGTVDNYFNNHFRPADISFISSHLVLEDVDAMIRNGRERFYNVNGVFFSNSITLNMPANASISALDWNERFEIENTWSDVENTISDQLNTIADSIVTLLINRTSVS